MDPTYPLAPALNFIGCFLILVSLVGIFTRPWNTGIFMLVVYVSLKSLVIGVNTTVWSNNVKDSAPIWCDIDVSIPACFFLITRRLFNIVRLRSSLTNMGRREKRNEIILEFLLCAGFPMTITGLYYTIQRARYDIYEQLGCYVATYPSGASFLLFGIGTLSLPLISLFVHTPKIIWTFYVQRREMAKFLDSTENNYRSDFVRPLVLSVVFIPPLILNLILNLSVYVILNVGEDQSSGSFIVFWPGWATIHSDWEQNLIPASLWTTYGYSSIFSLKYSEWVNALYAIGFFVIFGLTENSRKRYRSIFRAAIPWLGIRPKPSENKVASAIVFQFTAVQVFPSGTQC